MSYSYEEKLADIKTALSSAFQRLADRSNGKFNFDKGDESYLLEGKSVVGRSIENYVRLVKTIDLRELYHLILTEITSRLRNGVHDDEIKHFESSMKSYFFKI